MIHLKRINITKWLNKYEGGEWKYDRKSHSWYDSVSDKYVHRVCMVSDCGDCDKCKSFRYCLYGAGAPKWLFS